MVKLLLFLLIFATATIFSHAGSSIISPTEIKSFEPKTVQSCSYTVIIKTSCSSKSYTRDKISLAFGDAYGNEVYIKRLDDPYSRTFESCSTDTFQISGPCTYDICYQYLLRSGSDGWKPESVKIYGQNIRTVTFFYNTFIPDGVWFGFNQCRRGSGSAVV
ncbi:Embryo-specific protein ATS3A [Citrus sinensis]|uniref:Embryo-specific protein ATS3A n=1 Tax=Citrus sinensis TaxID=2711 RepID=A0ACB8NPY5_CITSI|nr:Embryo-specific protein ATS3A [Citrus sinensis]